MHSVFRARSVGALALLAACFGPVRPSQAVTIATFPAPTALENLVIDPAGDIFATSLTNGTIFRVTPEGASSVFGQVPGSAAGIARDTDGSLIVTGGTNVFRLAPNGSASVAASVAGASFLNGVTPFSPGVVLVADSRAGAIWQVDVNTGQSRPWSVDPRLAPVVGGAATVGANGVKIFGDELYVSNTSSGLVLRIPILPDGTAGVASVYASNIALDDFAFAVDGTLFGATQRGNSVVSLAPGGVPTTIATAADGLLGDAAVAFGRTAADARSIYVVNNRGSFLMLPGGPQDGSIVRLDVAIAGAALDARAVGVPEPLAAHLLASGLGLLLLVRRGGIVRT